MVSAFNGLAEKKLRYLIRGKRRAATLAFRWRNRPSLFEAQHLIGKIYRKVCRIRNGPAAWS